MEYIVYYGIVFLAGIIIGSFLNVCIIRIPQKEDIIFEPSHCRNCGSALKWYELIPLVSFLIQKGRCRNCRTGISLQYPLVELGNGLAYIWVFAVYGWRVESVLFSLCASVLIVTGVIDWRTYEIPPGCNVLIGILGICRLALDLSHWYNYVTGFFAVSGLFAAVYLLTKGRGIGGGDIKLMAAAGLLIGWQQILLALMIGSFAGSCIHLTLMKLKGKDRVLAFGPYLAFGIFTAMLYGEQMIAGYLSLFLKNY